MIKKATDLIFYVLYMGVKKAGGTRFPQNSAIAAMVLTEVFFLSAILSRIYYYLNIMNRFSYSISMLIFVLLSFKVKTRYFIKSGRWIEIVGKYEKYPFYVKFLTSIFVIGLNIGVFFFVLNTIDFVYDNYAVLNR